MARLPGENKGSLLDGTCDNITCLRTKVPIFAWHMLVPGMYGGFFLQSFLAAELLLENRVKDASN